MKINFILVLLLVQNIAFGQDFKDFAFFKATYDSARTAKLEQELKGLEYKGNLDLKTKNELKTVLYRSPIAVDDFFKIAQYFKIKVDTQKRKAIIDSLTKFIDNYKTEKGDIYSAKLFLEKLTSSKLSQNITFSDSPLGLGAFNVKVLDLNQDKKVDLILIPKVFFGPSIGYKFYAVEQNQIRYLYENTLDIEAIKTDHRESILKYSIPLFDVGECQISINFVCNHQSQSTKIYIVYYAGQSEFPQKINPNPQQFQTKQKTSLRFSPEINDSGEWTEDMQYDFDKNFGKAKFIKGNILAYYDSKAKGYILDKKGKWLFVAFFPHTKLLKTSLRHGMEDWKRSQIQPYICGWILEEDVE